VEAADLIIARTGVDVTLPRDTWTKIAERRCGAAFTAELVRWVDRYINEVRAPAETLTTDLVELLKHRPPDSPAKVIRFVDGRARHFARLLVGKERA
jgi:hypothetical protein